MFFGHGWILHFHLELISHKIALVRVLGLNGPGHFQISPFVTHVGTSLELVGESLVVHAFLDSIDDGNNIVDVLLEFLTLLKTCHRYQFCFLISYSIQVTSLVFTRW